MKYAVVIPARYQSSRFPGKPLADILGKPMIRHVWERCCTAVGKENVFVATDSDEIHKACIEFGAKVIITSSECLTGTDRLAEANIQLDCDFIINVQGDEPLINPNDILSVIAQYKQQPNTVINAMCEITSEEEFRSFNVPKVVTSATGELLYMSRAPIPVTKTNNFVFGFKQVCIYAFSREHLIFFASQKKKTPVEDVEDIEILRFLENDIKVKMIIVDSCSLAVDIPEDIFKVTSRIADEK